MQDLDVVTDEAIGNDEGRAVDRQVAGISAPARTAEMGVAKQSLCLPLYLVKLFQCCVQISARNIFDRGVARRLGGFHPEKTIHPAALTSAASRAAIRAKRDSRC